MYNLGTSGSEWYLEPRAPNRTPDWSPIRAYSVLIYSDLPQVYIRTYDILLFTVYPSTPLILVLNYWLSIRPLNFTCLPIASRHNRTYLYLSFWSWNLFNHRCIQPFLPPRPHWSVPNFTWATAPFKKIHQ